MDKSKSRIIIIIAIILIVFSAIGATFAVLYINTDLFKSEQEMFYKYMNQNKDIIEIFDISKLTEYSKKRESLPHTYESSLIYDVKNSETSTNTDNPQKGSLQLQISGKKDSIKNNESTDIKIKYGDTDLFHINSIKNDELYGILSEEIITKYIAVKNENLKEFLSKLGDYSTWLGIEDNNELPDKVQFNSCSELFSLTENQKKDIVNIYKSILNNNIPKESYKKQKDIPLLLNNNNINTTTYTLTLSESDVYVLLKNILETSKDSEVIINIIKEKARVLGYNNNQIDSLIKEYQEKIQGFIDDIVIGEKTEDEAVKVILYTANKQLLKTEIILYENTTVGLLYEQNDMQKKVNITVNKKDNTDQALIEIIRNISTEKYNVKITANLMINNSEFKIVCEIDSDIDVSSDKMKNSISLVLNNGTGVYRTDYNNSEDYSSNVEVDKLDSSNSVTLNNYAGEEIQKLMQAIEGRIGQVVQEKMQLLKSMNVQEEELLPLYIFPTWKIYAQEYR